MIVVFVLISVLLGCGCTLLWLVAEQRNAAGDRWHAEAEKLRQELTVARNIAESRRQQLNNELARVKALKKRVVDLREELVSLKERGKRINRGRGNV